MTSVTPDVTLEPVVVEVPQVAELDSLTLGPC